jgi:uncharacterized protein
MATRDLLPVIRAARAGDAVAQVSLGRHYLFGGSGLPRNVVSALHWLDRAARQQAAEACLLIGEHISFEVARLAADKNALLSWYDRAFESGVQRAGITMARLVMDTPHLHNAWHARALRVLHAAAQAGSADAQWLLAQHAPEGAPTDMPRSPVVTLASHQDARKRLPTPLEWAASAADAGIPAARHALAERAWAVADYTAFLRWSLPLAREVMQRCR